MARDEKLIELRPVDDDTPVPKINVPRLESDETQKRMKPVRLSSHFEAFKAPHRLDLPDREVIETRSNQPGIEALIETEGGEKEQSEASWGKAAAEQRHIPWGWFVLIAVILAGAVIWSLSSVNDADQQVRKVRVETATVLNNETAADLEASQLVERIKETTRRYFAAKDIEELVPLVRQAERVKPLMENYYRTRPAIISHTVATTQRLQPLTVDQRGDFWVISVKLDDDTPQNVIIDVSNPDSPKIDWETQVCYQPMDWDSFAKGRPTNTSYDFRVYVEVDTLYSHEFADSSQWKCFRLTTLGADSSVFGYARVDDAVSRELFELIARNRGLKISVIVRLSIPEGLQSRSGVVLEKLMSPRWLYIDPPDSGS